MAITKEKIKSVIKKIKDIENRVMSKIADFVLDHPHISSGILTIMVFLSFCGGLSILSK